MVIATTGFNNDELKLIEAASKEIPIFNMSYETNLVISLVSKLATILNDSDIEIVDVHHNKKVDSPSGTALMIADGINEALDNSMHYEFDRHSKRQSRDKKEIGIHSLRGGTEVGKHSVFFFGENESLEISHTVNSRAVFAKGALKAADFILNQENGLYNMKDLIK
jgi:4-hydroxy-tetrahydrodipicolinate reductase